MTPKAAMLLEALTYDDVRLNQTRAHDPEICRTLEIGAVLLGAQSIARAVRDEEATKWLQVTCAKEADGGLCIFDVPLEWKKDDVQVVYRCCYEGHHSVVLRAAEGRSYGSLMCPHFEGSECASERPHPQAARRLRPREYRPP